MYKIICNEYSYILKGIYYFKIKNEYLKCNKTALSSEGNSLKDQLGVIKKCICF